MFLEQLETDVSKYLPEVTEADVGEKAVDININMPMTELRALLSKYPVTTRLNLTGTLVVARDQAHAKILERVDSGQGGPPFLSIVCVSSAVDTSMQTSMLCACN